MSPWKWLLALASVSASASEEKEGGGGGLFGEMVSGLGDLPVVGNVLRASVHPLYRPLVSRLRPRIGGGGDGEDDEQCFGELGCLSTGPDFFHPVHRPVNLPPDGREEVGVVFTVHSRQDGAGSPVDALDVERVSATSFRASRRTKILVHGFLDHGGVTWMMEMVRALLRAGDYNVVAVDWSGGSRALYSQAAANARLVGLEVARLVLWLRENLGLEPGDVHVVGHSLGSHVAGYAGERIPGLGRITGLDPAEPLFQFMPPAVRLDPTDADFVDVIHTDADSILNLGTGYGLRQAVGHLDFYPNGGSSQPGCDSLRRVPFAALTSGTSLYEGLDAAQKELVACSHNRAARLFTDSMLSECPYLAFGCGSYERYMKGECTSCSDDGSGCARLGLRSDAWPRTNETAAPFFLSTGSGPSYCLYHYLLTVELGDPPNERGALRGRLSVSLIRDDGSVRDFDLSPDRPATLERGGSYTYFLHDAEDLSTSREALVRWTHEPGLLDYLVASGFGLPLVRVNLTGVDGLQKGRAVMCHQQGLGMVRVASGAMVKVAASPSCLTIEGRRNESSSASPSSSLLHHLLPHRLAGLLDAGMASLASMFSVV